jgi:hypothetical protein
MVGGAVARLTANSEPQAGERLCIWGRAEWLREPPNEFAAEVEKAPQGLISA